MKKLSLSSQKYRFGIRDPWSGKNLFRIPDPGVKKAPDPGSATLRKFYLFQIRIGRNNVWFWAEAAAAWRRRRHRQIRVRDGSQSQVALLRIRDVYPGSQIPDSNFCQPGYLIGIEEFKYFNPQIVSLLSEIWSGSFIPASDPDFFTHPGSRGQKGTGSRIRKALPGSTGLKPDSIGSADPD